TGFILARADDDQQKAAIGKQGAGRVWLFLKVDDFTAEFDRLTAAGVIFEELPRHEPYGKVAVFRDPFGNRWDLLGD
ncbi:MAG TPA: VOC family protein, partial [Sulfitobacter sp.]|nr:VOC family protein [Sulfitobacter sp.]